MSITVPFAISGELGVDIVENKSSRTSAEGPEFALGTTVRLDGFPGNEVWSASLDFEDRDVGPALSLIVAHCTYLIELLTRFYNAWDRFVIVLDTATDSERPMTVLQIVQMLVEHMEEHMQQIESCQSSGGETGGCTVR